MKYKKERWSTPDNFSHWIYIRESTKRSKQAKQALSSHMSVIIAIRVERVWNHAVPEKGKGKCENSAAIRWLINLAFSKSFT